MNARALHLARARARLFQSDSRERASMHAYPRTSDEEEEEEASKRERERASVIDLFSSGLGISGLRECTQCSTDTRTLTKRERASEFRENTRGQVRMCVCVCTKEE